MLENLFEHFNEKIMWITKMESKMYFWQQFTEKLMIKDDVKFVKNGWTHTYFIFGYIR